MPTIILTTRYCIVDKNIPLVYIIPIVATSERVNISDMLRFAKF